MRKFIYHVLNLFPKHIYFSNNFSFINSNEFSVVIKPLPNNYCGKHIISI